MAGSSKDQMEEAIIIPAARPKNNRCSQSGRSFLKKSTTAEPAQVIKNINPVEMSTVRMEDGMKTPDSIEVILSYEKTGEM
jgi:predicted RNA methylase